MKRRSVLGLLVAAVTGAAMPAPAAASERRGILIQESPLAGFQYHAGQTLWAQFCVDAPLQLLREPDNKYDRGAVAVYSAGQRIGYLPRLENAAEIGRASCRERVCQYV